MACYHYGFVIAGSLLPLGVLLVLCPASSRSPVFVPCRIDLRGRLLENCVAVSCRICGDVVVISSLPAACPVPNRSHISCGSHMYPFFAPAIDFSLPLVSNKTGSKTGRDFTPVLDLPLGNVSACGDSDVDVDERGRRGVLPVLFLLCLISFNRSASLNSNSSPLPLSSALVGLLARIVPPPPGVGGAGGLVDLRRRACVLLACVFISSCRSLALRLVRYCCRARFPFDGII